MHMDYELEMCTAIVKELTEDMYLESRMIGWDRWFVAELITSDHVEIRLERTDGSVIDTMIINRNNIRNSIKALFGRMCA